MSFNFDNFMRNMNSTIDSLQKKKDEQRLLEFNRQKAYNDRVLSEQERNNGAQRQLGFQQLELQKKQYQDASDNEYYRRKHVYDVQAGNMNPDTYAALYGGSAAGADGGNLRGKKGSSDNNQVDYAQLLSDAYKNRSEDDLRSFGDFSQDEMGTLQKLFPQQQSAGQAYNDRKTMKDSLLNQNVSMTRDPNGKMRFGIGQENADATGWDNVKTSVTGLRKNNPNYDYMLQSQKFSASPKLGGMDTRFYNPTQIRQSMAAGVVSGATQPAVIPPKNIRLSSKKDDPKTKMLRANRGDYTSWLNSPQYQ